MTATTTKLDNRLHVDIFIQFVGNSIPTFIPSFIIQFLYINECIEAFGFLFYLI